MSFQDASFLPSRASFSITFPTNCVIGKASGPPHALKQWLGASKGMLPVNYL